MHTSSIFARSVSVPTSSGEQSFVNGVAPIFAGKDRISRIGLARSAETIGNDPPRWQTTPVQLRHQGNFKLTATLESEQIKLESFAGEFESH